MSKCICPKCKSNNIIPIMYGYPSHDAFIEAEKGNLKFGGCEAFIGEVNQIVFVRIVNTSGS